MGFFSGMDQPGPGVYIDDPKDGPVVSFFKMYGSKFFTLCLCNLLFIVANIPALLISCLVGGYILPMISPSLSVDKLAQMIPVFVNDTLTDPSQITAAADQFYWLLIILSSFVLTGMLLVVFGPFQAALSYVYRNFARGNSSSFWQELIKAFKDNLKQSMIASIISTIVTIVLLINIGFYATVYTGAIATPLAVIVSVLLFFFMCIQLFVYPMIVSLELPLKKIYKNALIFTIIRLVPTVGVILVQLVVLLFIPLLLVSFGSSIGLSIAVAFYLTFAFSFAHFLGNFFAWYQIEKYIVAPQQNSGEDEKPVEEEKNNPSAEDVRKVESE